MRCGLLRNCGLASLAVGLIWMDVCLYYHIQALRNGADSSGKHAPHQPPAKPSDLNRSTIGKYFGRLSGWNGIGRDKSDTLRPVNGTIETPLSSVSYQLADELLPRWVSKFSYAFRGLSVKLIMSDPVDNYLLGPLADAFGELCNFRDNFKFISANMVSVSGVLSALMATKFLVSRQKWLAFGFFQLRTWLDNLDGVVARSRLGITSHVSLSHTSGYFVDGVCDAIGFLAFVWGVYWHLKHHSLHHAFRHLNKSERAAATLQTNQRRLLWLIGLFLLQLALASAGWNRYILKYNDLLEPVAASGQAAISGQATLKLALLKSKLMFVLAWFWRLTNGHSLMQLLAVAMLRDRTWNFLECIKLVGFIEIFALVAVTQLHTVDIGNFLALTSRD